MHYRERLLEIIEFLKPYQRIWQNEIMLMYPDPLNGYPIEWVEDLRRFKTKSDLIRIEKKDVFDYIQDPSLIKFYLDIEKLVTLPPKVSLPAMPEDSHTYLYMIPKKQHEIKNLAPVVNDIYQKNKIKQVIDIGGGIGLLAQTLVNQYQLKVTSLDLDQSMQKTGKDRHDGNAKDPSNKVIYKNIKVGPNEEFSQLLKDDVMPVGLHTCGRLAIDIIQTSSKMKVPALINFGCCYHTLENGTSHLQNISTFAQDNDPVFMSRFALTLANRAHKKLTEGDFDLKMKVKFFRYAIHILLHDHYDIKELVTLGNSTPKLYEGSFGHYVLEQFKRINLKPKHTLEELNIFYHNPKLKALIEQMLTAGIIRNALGRVLELYLVLDRAIFLEEAGYEVTVGEFFDEELSPRNLGIVAQFR